jgi:small GTP-binding protein
MDCGIVAATVGNSGVGKTTLCNRLQRPTEKPAVPWAHSPSIGVDYFAIHLPVNAAPAEGPRTPLPRLKVWDTAGLERFSKLTRAYLRGASVIIMVYDCGSVDSVSALETVWLPRVVEEHRSAPALPQCFCVLGNKADLLRGSVLPSTARQALDAAVERLLGAIVAASGGRAHVLHERVSARAEGSLLPLLGRIKTLCVEGGVLAGDDAVRAGAGAGAGAASTPGRPLVSLANTTLSRTCCWKA